MSEFARINAARPGKILDMLDTIDASARSNKATPQEVADLLAPVVTRLSQALVSPPFRGGDTPASKPQAAPGPIKAHDGELLVALRRAMARGTPDAIRAALAWLEAHDALKGA